MRIDVHAHYWTEDYLDLLIDLGRADAGAARSIGGGGGGARPRRSAVGDA
jgi:aminocarboxymuconate-semialdehyde decarboxylase